MDFLRDWFRRHVQDPQVVLLGLVLLLVLLAVLLVGRMLAPLIAALVIAYVLDGPAELLRRRGLPHLASVSVVFVGFLTAIAVGAVAVIPLLSSQLARLVGLVPAIAAALRDLVLTLPERYPGIVAREQVVEITARLQSEALAVGQSLLVFSFDSIGNVFTLVVYFVLVPFMVFFFLKDKEVLKGWIASFLPDEHGLVTRVWEEVDHKTGAYVRGKFYEVGVVGAVSWAAFSWLELEVAALLAALTGLSVLIPYIGVAVVSVPVALVGLFQFGPSGELAAVLGAYAVIQMVDGNLLAPLLISEIVDLHPIAVVASVLIFGGIWGFWGVFFAIPLATVAMAVLNALPRPPEAGRVPDHAEAAATPETGPERISAERQ